MKSVRAVAISGGIDSLFTAYLLKKEGYNLVGVHFLTGYENNYQSLSHDKYNNFSKKQPFFVKTPEEIAKIGEYLDITIKTIDCSWLFKKKIVDYFINSYKNGKTPNPCMVCNSVIKFDILYKFAEETGAISLSTGHYARIVKKNQSYSLLKGIDKTKDQSYFLAFLTQKQLSKILFPLGNYLKKDIIKFAAKNKIVSDFKKESQDICFINQNSYKDFFETYGKFDYNPGEIYDINKKLVGMHNGLHNYTVGQRKGINCPGPKAYYVLKIDVKKNILIVGFKDNLFRSECNLSKISWVISAPDTSILTLMTKIRYRHTPAESKLTLKDNNTGLLEFRKPQKAITPGQAAVFYKGDEIIGAGWIE